MPSSSVLARVVALGCALVGAAAYTPRPTTPLAQAADPNSALKPGQDPFGCVASKDSSVDTDWCRTQCGSTPPNCPVSLCKCSDDGGIQVYDSEDDVPKTGKSHNKKTTSEETAADPTSALKPGADPMSCKAKLKANVDTAWCQTQCGGVVPNCPKDMCRCEDPSGAHNTGKGKAGKAGSTEPAPSATTPETDAAADAIQAANDAQRAAAEAAADANAAASSSANAAAAANADASGSALAPGGDPMGCIAVKGAPEGTDDDWCRNQCADNPDNCPKAMCECDDDNGVLRYDPNDPDIPLKRLRKRQTPPAAQAPAPAAQAPAPAAQAPAPTGEDAIQAANDAYQKAAEAAAAASEAAASAASSVSESALAPGGDPMGCLAVKDAPESIDDDYCRKQCSDSPDNCPKTFCECDDDNGVLRYDPNDPDIPLKGREEKLEATHPPVGSRQ